MINIYCAVVKVNIYTLKQWHTYMVHHQANKGLYNPIETTYGPSAVVCKCGQGDDIREPRWFNG